MEILVVQDHSSTLAWLVGSFREHGYSVRSLTGERVIAAEEEVANCDLIVVDDKLSTLAATEVCQTLRMDGVLAPILVLTDRDTVAVVAALDAGADSCVAAPYSREELMAQVRALLRRRANANALAAPKDWFSKLSAG